MPSEFITAMHADKSLEATPSVIYGGEAMTNLDRTKLEKLSATGVVKKAASLDRLLDKTALFLHRDVSRLSKEKFTMFQQLHQSASALTGRNILIVDDDRRNIYALTSALEPKGVIVSSAESGASAIELLKSKKNIDLVLMDIMMPEMDGYETMGQIRKISKYEKVADHCFNRQGNGRRSRKNALKLELRTT